MDLKKVFTDRNPFFEHAEMQLWVAVHEGRDVGRIAAIEDRSFNARQPIPTAYFGFFESIESVEVSAALFAAAERWSAQRGFVRIIGPMNPSSNDECGLLVQGFDRRPVFMMPYNPRYYLDLVAQAGFQKSKDLIAFDIDLRQTPMQRLERVAARYAKRQSDIHFRPVRRKTLRADLAKVKEIYNEAWDDNWGFVPMTDGEIDFMAERLKPMLAEGLVWLAETDEQPVGFLLAMPDFNEALQPLRGPVVERRIVSIPAVSAPLENARHRPRRGSGRERGLPQPRHRVRHAGRRTAHRVSARVHRVRSVLDSRRQLAGSPRDRTLRRPTVQDLPPL